MSCPTAIALPRNPEGTLLALSCVGPGKDSEVVATSVPFGLYERHPRGVAVRVGGVYIWGER
eukprot:scaffold65103_cov31-Tisochrysis_lutea.AAC.1